MKNEETFPYNPKLVSITENELKKIDEKNILNNRLEFLAVVLAVVQDKGYKYSDIKLIECGSHPVDLDLETSNSKYQPSISYFFANYPNFLEYKGYDAVIDIDNMGIEEGVTKNKEKFVLEFEKVLTNIQSQYIGSKFYDLIKETYTNKKLVICSNLVLGVAKEHAPFWNLPGLHIHQFLEGDFEKGGMVDKDGKHPEIFNGEYTHWYKTLDKKINSIYHIYSNLKLFKGKKNEKYERCIVYEN